MHYLLEVIMPPTSDVSAALDQILMPFSECGHDEDGEPNRYAFFDYFQIGGRWSGSKMEAMIGEERVAAFREELVRREVTVSNVQFGKPELRPASQCEMVDALWQEWFPDCGFNKCPLFKHSGEGELPLDVCKVSKLPPEYKAHRVIVAGQEYDNASKLRAAFMWARDVWNGVSGQETTWDGKVAGALSKYRESVSTYRADYAAKMMPGDDWLVVSVDYHS